MSPAPSQREGSPFSGMNLLIPRVPPARESETIKSRKIPGFLPPRNFYRFGWWELLAGTLARYRVQRKSRPIVLFRQIPVCPRRFAVEAIVASLIIHLVGYAFFPPFFYRFGPSWTDESERTRGPEKVVYYYFPKQEAQKHLPKILPPGLGSIPGAGSDPARTAAMGATKSLGELFAISHPQIPDNRRQTIVQSNTPPDLRIKQDLKLPNILLAKPTTPKAPITFEVQQVRPVRPEQRQYSQEAPTLTNSGVTTVVAAPLTPLNTNPHLPVPLGAAPAPVLPSQHSGTFADGGAPQMEMAGGTGEGLVILGTDPDGSADALALPRGNRFGEFSIAPGGPGAGSPGGQEGGTIEAGSGGEGLGGKGSTGIGPGAYVAHIQTPT